MATRRRASPGGSRYLYEPFELASIREVEAHERMVRNQIESVERHFGRLEAAVERLETRLWMTVYGVAAMVLAEIARAFLEFGLGG